MASSIAVRDTIVHIVWRDYRDGDSEIYYKKSEDNGESWGLDERLINIACDKAHPSVAVWDCPYDVHVVWTDYRDGDSEIYYKRHKCEPQGVEEVSESSQVESYRLQVVKGVVYLFTPDDLEANVKIYDICGRVVDVLNKPRGEEKLVWENKGAPGVYFFVVESGVEKVRLKGVVF